MAKIMSIYRVFLTRNSLYCSKIHFLFNETKVSVVNWLKWHYKLQHLFCGALCNQWKYKKMCCSIWKPSSEARILTNFVPIKNVFKKIDYEPTAAIRNLRINANFWTLNTNQSLCCFLFSFYNENWEKCLQLTTFYSREKVKSDLECLFFAIYNVYKSFNFIHTFGYIFLIYYQLISAQQSKVKHTFSFKVLFRT